MTNSEIPAKARNFDKTFEEEKAATKCLVDMKTIQLNAEDLYDREKVDLEQVELEDVWVLLQSVTFGSHHSLTLTSADELPFVLSRTSENGLDTAEVERRRAIFGPNRLEEKSVNPFLQFLSFMWK
jgi:H+-transporting ATPase